jgi:hypothetical protein
VNPLIETYLPRADPVLIHDLLVREEQQQMNPKTAAPFYMVVVFTKPGTDSEAMRNMIIEKTQMVPAIYDNQPYYYWYCLCIVSNSALILHTTRT